MMTQALHVDFSATTNNNGADGDTAAGAARSPQVNGNGTQDGEKTFKWNKVTSKLNTLCLICSQIF